MLSWSGRDNKPLKMPSEGLIFQNFLGGMPPDPQNLVLINQIYINCFAISMLSWNSRNSKPLKMPSDSISEGLIFQKFSGGACSQTPLDLTCSACLNMCFAHNYYVHHIVACTLRYMSYLTCL